MGAEPTIGFQQGVGVILLDLKHMTLLLMTTWYAWRLDARLYVRHSPWAVVLFTPRGIFDARYIQH